MCRIGVKVLFKWKRVNLLIQWLTALHVGVEQITVVDQVCEICVYRNLREMEGENGNVAWKAASTEKNCELAEIVHI